MFITFTLGCYSWVPYLDDPQKCELNCQPEGERYWVFIYLHTHLNEDVVMACIHSVVVQHGYIQYFVLYNWSYYTVETPTQLTARRALVLGFFFQDTKMHGFNVYISESVSKLKTPLPQDPVQDVAIKNLWKITRTVNILPSTTIAIKHMLIVIR